MFFLVLYIPGALVNARSYINITPKKTVKFKVDTKPTSDVAAEDGVRFKRVVEGKQQIDDNEAVYYRAEALEGSNGYRIPAKYILAKQLYWSNYQSMDDAVLFLNGNDGGSRVKFKLAKEAWDKVPSGVYRGWLRSSEAADIKVEVHIKAHTAVRVGPDNIEINATGKPGVYEAEDKVNIIIESNNPNWDMRVYADPLTYESDEIDNTEQIAPERISIALGDKEGDYYNLGTGFVINGDRYKHGAVIDAFVKVKTGWKDTAGKYRGRIWFVMSERN